MIKKICRFIQRFNKTISMDYSLLARKEIVRAICENNAYHQSDYALNTKKRDFSLVVSLTSYSNRVNSVYQTIQSLFEQSLKPDSIILWLDRNEFNDSKLPIILGKMKSNGLDIRYCDNIRSYKKLIPSIELFKDSIIITVDDDIIYPRNLLETMMETHFQYPNCIVCNYGLEIKRDKGKLSPYSKWEMCSVKGEPSNAIIGIGVGGILYPPNSLFDDCTNADLFCSLAPTTDDLWFKIMALKKSTKYIVNQHFPLMSSERIFLYHFIPIEDKQEEKLGSENVCHGGNDTQIKKIMQHYSIKEEDFFK